MIRPSGIIKSTPFKNCSLCLLLVLCALISSSQSQLPPSSYHCFTSIRNSCSVCFTNSEDFYRCSRSGTGLNQINCIRQCCDDDQNTQFTQELIEECQKSNVSEEDDEEDIEQQETDEDASQSLAPIYIVVIVVVSVAVLAICLCKFCYANCKNFLNRNSREAGSGASEKNLSNLPIGQQRYQSQHQCVSEEEGRKILGDPANICCICLEGRADTVTFCKHGFHLKCLLPWSQKKQVCPLCNSKSSLRDHKVAVFCPKCLENKIQTVYIAEASKSKLNLAKKLKNLQCQKCKRGEYIRVKGQHSEELYVY